MTVLFSVVLLVLALGMVMLFAMVGEVAGRVGGSDGTGSRSLVPLEEAELGRRPVVWPDELGELSESPGQPALLLVLSASCRSCSRVARQLVDKREEWAGRLQGVVISAASLDRARQFQSANDLHGFRLFLDDGGDWVTSEFGVQTSPSALLLRDGQLDAAYIFDDMDLLVPLIPRRTEAA